VGRGRQQNLYSPGSIEGASADAIREIQNLYDRINYLTQEVERFRTAFPEMVDVSARKENPTEGIITVPSTGYGGQNGFIKVSKDGVIKSYASPSSIGSGAPKWFNRSSTLFGTAANTTETNFGVVTAPPGTLAENDDFLVMRFRGFSAGGANTKRYRGYLNTTLILDTGLQPYGGGWEMGILLTRLNPLLLRCQEYFFSTNSTGLALLNANINLNTFPFPPNAGGADFAITSLESTTLTYQVTGTNGAVGPAANDCTQNWQDAYVVNFF